MSASRRRRTRRHRRTVRARLRFGKHAAPRHNRKTGRTGSIFRKYLKTLKKAS